MAKREKRINLFPWHWVAVALFYMLALTPVMALPDRPESFKQGDFKAAEVYLDEYIEEWMDDESVPGVSITVFDRNSFLLSKAYGYADLEEDIKTKPDTVFRVGGLTTLFTSLAIMQLQEQGKINLLDPVSKYLPGFVINTRWATQTPINIHQLLIHYSGLPVSIFKGMWAFSPTTPEAMLDQLALSYAAFQPGEIYAFSNLGYVLLGMIIERASGMPYAQYVEQNIIKPLGLKHTGFSLTPEMRKQFAKGYKKEELKPVLQTRDVAALGLYSTSEDMARFVQAFITEQKVISAGASSRMLTPQNRQVRIDTGHHIGYGWQLDDARMSGVNHVANRWGSTLLFRSRVMLLPEFGLGVVINANSSKGFRVVDEVAAEAMKVMLEVVQGVPQKVVKDEELVLEPVNNIAPFQTEYSTMAGYSRIRQKGSEYYANIMGWNLHLRPQGNGWYGVQYDFLGFLPIKLDWFAKIRIAPVMVDSEPALLSHFNGRTTLFGSTLPNNALNEKWKNRVGEYMLANPDELTEFYEVKEGHIREENGRLLFDYNLPFFMETTVTLPLVPLDDNLAIIPGKGSAFNEVIRVVRRDGGERLVYSGYELEKQAD
ncbi:MAG: beta-lactamase family protein [Gammaproteobacteria bacterium]|nr:beta-lactamase family protein [Gammaproteobacteria bacterium]